MWLLIKRRPVTLACVFTVITLATILWIYMLSSEKINYHCVDNKDMVCTTWVISKDLLQCEVSCEIVTSPSFPTFRSIMPCHQKYCIARHGTNGEKFEIVPDNTYYRRILWVMFMIHVIVVVYIIRYLRRANEELMLSADNKV